MVGADERGQTNGARRTLTDERGQTNGDRGAEGGEGAVGADEGAIGPDGVGVDRQGRVVNYAPHLTYPLTCASFYTTAYVVGPDRSLVNLPSPWVASTYLRTPSIPTLPPSASIYMPRSSIPKFNS